MLFSNCTSYVTSSSFDGIRVLAVRNNTDDPWPVITTAALMPALLKPPKCRMLHGTRDPPATFRPS
jgi:hypothetical protein